MGEPVKIAELAGHMVRLSGLEPAFVGRDEGDAARRGDIEIVYSGLRPGEKLYEELLIGEDPGETRHPRIMTANEVSMAWAEMRQLLRRLLEACNRFDYPALRELLLEAPTGYQPRGGIEDLLWHAQQANRKQAQGDGDHPETPVDLVPLKNAMSSEM